MTSHVRTRAFHVQQSRRLEQGGVSMSLCLRLCVTAVMRTHVLVLIRVPNTTLAPPSQEPSIPQSLAYVSGEASVSEDLNLCLGRATCETLLSRSLGLRHWCGVPRWTSTVIGLILRFPAEMDLEREHGRTFLGMTKELNIKDSGENWGSRRN